MLGLYRGMGNSKRHPSLHSRREKPGPFWFCSLKARDVSRLSPSVDGAYNEGEGQFFVWLIIREGWIIDDSQG
jgi:hypothetical protein